MKRFTKVCLMIAAVFLVLGVGITTAAGAMGGRLRDLPVITYGNSWNGWHGWNYWNNWDNWNNWEDDWSDWERDFNDTWDDSWADDLQKELEQIPQEVQDDVAEGMEEFHKEMESFWAKPVKVIETTDFTGIRKLNVEVEVSGVQIIAVDADDEDGDLVSSGDIRVKVGSGDDASKYRVYVKDGDKLCIETKWSKRNNYRNSLNRGRRLQILVPRGYQFDDVDLEVSAGALDADEMIARSLDAKMNAGSLVICNGNVEELDSEVNAGEMSYGGIVSRSLEGECRAGSLNLLLTGKEEDYNYEVSASAGAVTIGDDSYASLKSRNIRNNGAAAEMDLSCMAGSLTVTFTE